MTRLTKHAQLRVAQRNLDQEAIEYVICYGERLHRAGALIYFLRKRDIPVWDQVDPECSRLAGTAVILTKDGRQVITSWRNQKNGLRKIKKKPKFTLFPETWAG
jgi:hypothetical protein